MREVDLEEHLDNIIIEMTVRKPESKADAALNWFAKDLGDWHTVFTRYNRWSKKGRWQVIFEALSQEPDLEYLMVDGSIARVHQHGAPKKTLKKPKPLANPEGD